MPKPRKAPRRRAWAIICEDVTPPQFVVSTLFDNHENFDADIERALVFYHLNDAAFVRREFARRASTRLRVIPIYV